MSLLRKLRSRSRLRTKSIASEDSPQAKDDIPPLPTAASIEIPFSSSPRTASPLNTPTDQDGLDSTLKEAWSVATKENEIGKADKALQYAEDQVNNGQALKKGVTKILDATGGTAAIHEGINHFMDGSQVFMKALDELGHVHPFVGVAVLAFKTVWTLEMKRRDNDKKIIALHVEMKDMMGVLLQLKDVHDVATLAPDGTTIEGRIQKIIHQTASDIKECGNVCDAYSKKKLVVKVLKGPIWEGLLLNFVGTFTKRRAEFESAMSIHTTLGVDAANRGISSIDETAREMNAKLDLMKQMFEQFVAPAQKNLLIAVQARGGPEACQNSDKALKELSEIENKAEAASYPTPTSSKELPTNAVEDLRKELVRTDPEQEIEKNMLVFTRKFELQQRQFDELGKTIQRESDRVIDAVTSGPHDKIIDLDVHTLWKEMQWRGNVKARYFVLAIRDYFLDKWHMEEKTGRKSSEDAWTLEHLSVTRLQPVSEAFDDDASGFITVAEVNTFTTSRPQGWSLPHWIAFWAIGWHQSMIKYRGEITDLIAKMFAILPRVPDANRVSVAAYIKRIYELVMTFVDSINDAAVNDALQARFKSYTEAEESRLRKGLEDVKHDIDQLDTLSLITGPGRIEKFILPLLSLLLKHHFEIIRVSQVKIIHPDELRDAVSTIERVMYAAQMRVEVLRSIFLQQRVDASTHFRSFAHGLFKYSNDPTNYWAASRVKGLDPPKYVYDDSTEASDVKLENFLKYPYDQDELDIGGYYDMETTALNTADPAHSTSIAGIWNGYLYATQFSQMTGMISMDLKLSTPEGSSQPFSTSGRYDALEYTLVGQSTEGASPGIFDVTFKISYFALWIPEYYQGQFEPASGSLAGTWGYDDDYSANTWPFIFKRTPAMYMCFRPIPPVLESNRPRALWRFVAAAVLYDVRKKSWSKRYFDQRRESKNRFIELQIRYRRFGRDLDEVEEEEMRALWARFNAADNRFYHSLFAYKARRIIEHNDIFCDNCRGTIGGPRIICLTCQIQSDAFNTIDLCEDCICACVDRHDLESPHIASHDLVKVRRAVFVPIFGKVDRNAKAALRRVRELFGPKPGGQDKGENKIAESEGGDDEGTQTVARSLQLLVSPSDSKRFSVQTRESASEALICHICYKAVTQPCWYCVQCEDNVFICEECDAQDAENHGDHSISHDLVRCQEVAEDARTSVEDRLDSLEGSFAKHEMAMDQKLARLESTVDDRLSRFDSLESSFAKHEMEMNQKFVRLESTVGERLSKLETLLEKFLELRSNDNSGSLTQAST